MRSPTPPTDLETDPRFPSGEWSGFFLEMGSPQRHWMVFYLEFRQGQIRGEGNDYVGTFHLSGKYDTTSGLCQWTKQYIGRHQVAYEGLNRAEGIIGRWKIGEWSSDQFHIWPKGLGNLESQYFEADLIASGGR